MIATMEISEEIAEKLGYSSIHQFTRRFSATVGFPPGEFRQRQVEAAQHRYGIVPEDGGPVV